MDEQQQKDREAKITELAVKFCNEHLDEECGMLCTKLIERVVQKRDNPMCSGQVELWAAATVYCICSINLLFGNHPRLKMAAPFIGKYFGFSHTYLAQKSREIKNFLKVDTVFDTEFKLKDSNRNSLLSWVKKFFFK